MATEDAPPIEYRSVLSQALSQWQEGQQDAALVTLQPAVDAGVMPAIIAAAWMHYQRSQHAQAAPLVEQALSEGIVLPALWGLGSFLSDPDFKQLGVNVIRGLADFGVPYDPVSQWQTLWAQGDVDHAVTLFEIAATPHIRTLRDDLTTLLSDSRESTTEIQNAAAVVSASREEAIGAIRAHETAIAEERERVEKLVVDTTSLVHGVTADHIAKAYAARAQNALHGAAWWTGAAILTGILAAGWAVFVAVHSFREGSDVGTTETIGKVLVSLPILVVAGYLASIAASNRRMGYHWSHVELQIRTAEPFIANLDQDTRNRLLAALAIRFFPGQGQDPQHGGASSESLDVGTLISGILHELAPRRTPAAPPEATPPAASG